MTPRELQYLCSLIETEQETNHHPTLAITIHTIKTQHPQPNPTNHELYTYLKNQHGPPTGQISKTATKQLYEHTTRTNNSIIKTITNITNKYNIPSPHHLSDDMLCQTL